MTKKVKLEEPFDDWVKRMETGAATPEQYKDPGDADDEEEEGDAEEAEEEEEEEEEEKKPFSAFTEEENPFLANKLKKAKGAYMKLTKEQLLAGNAPEVEDDFDPKNPWGAKKPKKEKKKEKAKKEKEEDDEEDWSVSEDEAEKKKKKKKSKKDKKKKKKKKRKRKRFSESSSSSSSSSSSESESLPPRPPTKMGPRDANWREAVSMPWGTAAKKQKTDDANGETKANGAAAPAAEVRIDEDADDFPRAMWLKSGNAVPGLMTRKPAPGPAPGEKALPAKAFIEADPVKLEKQRRAQRWKDENKKRTVGKKWCVGDEFLAPAKDGEEVKDDGADSESSEFVPDVIPMPLREYKDVPRSIPRKNATYKHDEVEADGKKH